MVAHILLGSKIAYCLLSHLWQVLNEVLPRFPLVTYGLSRLADPSHNGLDKRWIYGHEPTIFRLDTSPVAATAGSGRIVCADLEGWG